jgi:(p)ppGpp synthase/HD superfamily hydrolase
MAEARKTVSDDGRSLAMLTQAYDLAARAHAGQRRKGIDVPYINHPCAVAAMTAEALGHDDIEAIAAAVLHDVLEDTEVTEPELAARFGPRVTALVKELTDAPDWLDLPLLDRKARQAEKMARGSIEARVIKIADQLSNIGDLCMAFGAWPQAHNRAYLAGAQTVVDACRGVAPRLEAAFDAVAKDFQAALDKEAST